MTVTTDIALPKLFLKHLEESKIFSLDLECDPPPGGKQSDAKLWDKAIPTYVCLSTGEKANVAYALRMTPQVEEALRWLMGRPDLTCVIQNVLYDVRVLHKREIVPFHTINCYVVDTMIPQFLINENRPRGLKEMVWAKLHHRMVTYKEATTDNPQYQEMLQCQADIAAARKSVDTFERQRPWPRFDSKRIVVAAELKRRFRKEKDELFAGEHVHKDGVPQFLKNGEPKLKYNPAEQKARREYMEPRLAKIDTEFGFERQSEYAAFVEREVIPPKARRVKQLRKLLEKQFKAYGADDARWTLKLWYVFQREIKKLDLVRWQKIECKTRMTSVGMSLRGVVGRAERIKELVDYTQPLVDEFRSLVSDLARCEVGKKKGQLNPDSPKQLTLFLFGEKGLSIPEFRRATVYDDDGYEHEVGIPKLTDDGNNRFHGRGDYKEEPEHHDVELRLIRDKDGRYPPLIEDMITKGQIACDNEVFERLDHPLGMALLNYRSVSKLWGTYIKKIADLIENDPEGLIRTTFKSIAAKTGRWASATPINLQNIPSRRKPEIYDPRIQALGPKIRGAFGVLHNWKTIIADMSQIELRIITHLTRDRELFEVYTRMVEVDGIMFPTGDIHAKTSGELGIPRKLAKNVNFGFNYGMRALKFARQIRLFLEGSKEYDLVTAEQWREGFFNTYPGIENRCNALSKAINREHQRIFKILSGRSRHFEHWEKPAGAKAFNSEVQGAAGDLLKCAMYAIERWARPHFIMENSIDQTLDPTMQVHDEAHYNVRAEHAEEACLLVKYALEYPWFKLNVPLLSSAQICDGWEDSANDRVPEFGTMYGNHKDKGPMLFTADNWNEFVDLDDAKMFTEKSAAAVLTPAQVKWAQTIFPMKGGPMIKVA